MMTTTVKDELEMIDVSMFRAPADGAPSSWSWSVSFAGQPPHSAGVASSKAEAYALIGEVFRGLALVRRVRHG